MEAVAKQKEQEYKAPNIHIRLAGLKQLKRLFTVEAQPEIEEQSFDRQKELRTTLMNSEMTKYPSNYQSEFTSPRSLREKEKNSPESRRSSAHS